MKKFLFRISMLLFACSLSALIAWLFDLGTAGFAASLAAMAYMQAMTNTNK